MIFLVHKKLTYKKKLIKFVIKIKLNSNIVALYLIRCPLFQIESIRESYMKKIS